METEKILPQGLQVPNHSGQIRLIKTLWLGVISVLAFSLTWFLLRVGLFTDQNFVFWIWPSLSAAAAISLLAMISIVDIKKWIFWGVNLAILLSYLVILPKNIYTYIGGGLFFLFVWLFERRIQDDEHARADFSASRILRSSIGLMVYGLLIVLGFNLYAKIDSDFQKNPDAIYSKIGYYAARGLKHIPSGVGDFNPNQSFDEFAAKQVQKQEPGFESAPPSVQEQLIEQLKNQLSERFNIQIQGNPLLGDVVAGAIATKTEEGSKSYNKFFPAIFTVIIVIILRSASFLFVWLCNIISWILFKLLLSLKFFRIDKVQVEVEKLSI